MIQRIRHALKRLIPLCALVLTSVAPSAHGSDSTVGVLILAQGGGSHWIKMVKAAVKQADLPYPTQLFFGDCDTAREVHELQGDVEALESDGAHSIIAIPLMVSSFSPVARQWKYLLGVDFQPGFISNPSFPLEKHSNIHFMEPLNDSAVMVEILLDRAQEISEQPSKESVVIVSNGAADESDNARWIAILKSLCQRIKERGGFKTVEGFTLRDEATSAVRTQSLATLRNRISGIDEASNRPLVIPLVLFSTGLENRLGLELRGLTYAFNTKTLLPDNRIAEWIRSQVP
jgi:sirohydrochlorin cobaltochelatase